MQYLTLISAVLFAAACGGDGRPEGDCVPGSSDSYLPFRVGNSWTFEVRNTLTPDIVTTKSQSVTAEMNYPGDGMPAFIQVTNKAEGSTVSWLRVVGDRHVRLEQQDRDLDGLLERTTVYEPSKLRLDQSQANLAMGATYDDTYMKIVYDENGVEIERLPVTENWEVLAESEPCPGEFADFDCVRLSRSQTGLPPKVFWFSPGIGKVKEDGGQIETLTSCSLD
jgi:hypothetical protein